MVFVGEKLRKELAAYVKTLKRRDQEQLPLFRTQKRDGFSANTLCQYFHWMYLRAGIEGASSHSGRRTFITNLASKGVGVRVLASLAGHRSIATTQAYIDVNDDQKRKAVELVF
jgi:integrase/recombinase XerD